MRLALLALLSIVSLAPGSIAQADDEVPAEDPRLYSCKKGTGLIEVTLKPETEVKDLVTWVMGFTCKNFVYEPRIVATGRKVTIIAPVRMTPTEAYRLFLASLSTLGLTVVPSGNLMKVVESASAKHQPVPLYKGGQVTDTDQLVRYVLRPAYMQADALAKALGTVKSDPGEIVVAGSLLMIADYASHVRDMLSLATLIDVPGGSEGIYTIPVMHADATKLAATITQTLGVEGQPGLATKAPTALPRDEQAAAPSKILVDDRTNTLIVAASVAGYERVRALVERLDVELDTEGGLSIHVYQLESAIAEEVAKTLMDSLQKAAAPQGGPRPPAATPPGAAAIPAELGTSVVGDVKITADAASNKLLVLSSGRDYLAIKDVIKELDEPRRQVYLEASIVEIALTNDLSLGASSHGGVLTDAGGVTLAGVQTGALSSLMPSSLAGASGLVAGVVGKALESDTLLGQSIPSYGVLVNAMAKRSNSNVTQMPSIIAVDNVEAKFKVGRNIPYKRGVLPTTLASSVTTSLSTNIDRQDLNLELTIKPHISDGDHILLEIKHEAKDLGDPDPELGPTWNTRLIETRTVVRDQQTAVISGIIQERESVSATQVPLLGDIPLLGYLFKYKTRTKSRSNLLIMITPYIIKGDMDLEEIKARHVRQQREFETSLVNLREASYQPRIDYRRKRGLLEEINRSVQLVEQDAAARQLLRTTKPVAGGAIQ